MSSHKTGGVRIVCVRIGCVWVGVMRLVLRQREGLGCVERDENVRLQRLDDGPGERRQGGAGTP